ncbi:mitochondria protoheme IX farnesyltransferase [Annulohypoxylon truncatum]|uniref:mitochondria protoheme IX farnesyltransferase n=1 Tax=Annulohypoxylon truncatum TaxID=327061 RepID=UPI002007EDEC|nr:mitochondria protoheme IX farnesyltransferase [Annulohypoxylon truncatum]KAI1206961.1 mitochondria protoheme IX farnesyltransferase [Annulohypoxylon truncatum]
MRPRPAGNLFRPFYLDNICWRCSQQLNYARTPARRAFAHSVAPPPPKQKSRLKAGYFISNRLLPRIQTPRAASLEDGPATGAPAANHAAQDLPHRRRRAARRNTTAGDPSTASNTSDPATAAENPLPQDASSALTTASTKHPADSLRRQISLLLSLSKPRLTVLIVLTAMAPYALYPIPAFLSPSIGLDTPSLSPLTLTFLTTGTALCSASANALNMLYEPAWDAKMTRTRNRPLVRGLLSERKALVFAILAASAGVGGLYFGVNPTVAFLGAANIALYAGVYTPMKRISWLNTWVGAIVGGIPPLMGWAAAAGESATGDGSFRELLLTPDAIGGWLFAAVLFAWQFPHFMALSWPIREEYKAAGHKMLCWINPARNARVALRYSLLFFPLSIALCAVGVTEWTFAVTSLPVNFWLAREAVRFWRSEGFKGSARGLFWASVWHLPVIMVLALVQKKGMWGRVWRSVVGEPDFEDEEDEDWIADEVGEEAEVADDGTRTVVPPIGPK